MKNLKTIIISVAVVLGAIIAFLALGMVLATIQYIFWLAVICLVAAGAYKLLKKPHAPCIAGEKHVATLRESERTLEEYKRQLQAK